MKKALVLALVVGSFLSLAGISYAQNPFQVQFIDVMNTGANTDATSLIAIATSIGGFLLIIGAVIAGIVIIVAGLMWMAAGSNPARVQGAKAVFKNGIIGALILFAAGLIVNTIILIATNWQSFFS